MQKMETTDKGTITIETLFHSPIQNVWQAWTDPDLILTWFGSDPHGKVLEAKLDVRPGGLFEVTFTDADQTKHTCSGTYIEVQEFTKLSFSWTWKSEPGVESFVTLSLSADSNFTRMQFEHAHVGNESRHDYLNGWKATFLKLEQMLTNQKMFGAS